MIYERNNLRFSSRPMSHKPDNRAWLIDVYRISDGHWLPEQMWFDADLTESEMNEAADYWTAKHPDLNDEPAPTLCYACDKVLVSDHDTDYQFDNALWVGLHGGYSMFTDSMGDIPINTRDRFTDEVICRFCKTPLHDAGDGTWVDASDGDGCPGDDDLVNENASHFPEVVEDPDWVPEYEEERVLPGRPDHEAVICHECAHHACDVLPWLNKLIEPQRSHAHRSADIPRLLSEGHRGWDLDRQREE